MDDVTIEIKQAIEMASIFTGILTAMMDAFSYVIANNQNAVMWRLTIITVIIQIPNIIFGFYGMNTGLPFRESWILPFSIALVATLATALALLPRRRF